MISHEVLMDSDRCDNIRDCSKWELKNVHNNKWIIVENVALEPILGKSINIIYITSKFSLCKFKMVGMMFFKYILSCFIYIWYKAKKNVLVKNVGPAAWAHGRMSCQEHAIQMENVLWILTIWDVKLTLCHFLIH